MDDQIKVIDSEDTGFRKQEAHYRRIQRQNGFKSQWSLYDIKDVTAPIPFVIHSLTFLEWTVLFPENQQIQGRKLTWESLWHAADFLTRQSGIGLPVYIEGFDEVRDGEFELAIGT